MIQKLSENEIVCDELRKDIIQLRLEPNAKLSEVQLMERYHTSRARVRWALSQLSDEGLVDVRPQSGTFVTPISYQKAANIRAIRYMLEPYAARVAAPQVSEKDLLYLEVQFKRLEEHLDMATRNLVITEIDEALHDVILDNCGNAELADIIRRFRPTAQRVSLFNIAREERNRTVLQEMKSIFAALKARDGEAAFETMQTHIDNIKLNYLENKGG